MVSTFCSVLFCSFFFFYFLFLFIFYSYSLLCLFMFAHFFISQFLFMSLFVLLCPFVSYFCPVRLIPLGRFPQSVISFDTFFKSIAIAGMSKSLIYEFLAG